ncbi:aldose 1-epimerase [Geosmithia morbida]|uniref:Aldose 1-epimerase n=1 Tax=Geosmithia morbida TaxID=1094350 RepID=A0A9P4Z2E2_9HYPO|nr:aldose 1-epimerase [Geosmithia morbida]KAF4126172.1 aldose 1-epimerase [Geosmithia morbida]
MADAFTFLPLGAIIQSFTVNGRNIVQGFDTADQYESHNQPYFGETIGRVANRVKGGRIDSLNGGKTYELDVNDRGNTCHSGSSCWGKKTWTGPMTVSTRDMAGVEGLTDAKSFSYSLTSPDGEGGFPGTVEVTAVYTTGTQKGAAPNGKDVSVLGIEYEARLVDGADETAINMTNHSYFNPAGAPTAPTCEGTVITLATNQHLPVDETAIPTGGPVPFPGLDTSKPFTMTPTDPDVDHCFVIDTGPSTIPIDTRGGPLRVNLSAHHPKTGVNLEVLSTEPAFQFYTGGFIDVPATGNLPARAARSGFCCEPSRWINAVNVPEWKNMVLLKKGETYGTRIVYRGWAD